MFRCGAIRPFANFSPNEFTAFGGDFLLRELVVRSVFLHALELAHALQALLDGAEVRERAAEPAVDDVVTPGPCGLFLHDVLRLALRADHEDVAATGDGLLDEAVRAGEKARRLIEVDDVDAVARAVDERAHLRVPALGLVAEVDAGVEERTQGQRQIAAELRQALSGCFGCLGHGCASFRLGLRSPSLTNVSRIDWMAARAPGKGSRRGTCGVGGRWSRLAGPVADVEGAEGTRGPQKSKL